MTTQRRSSEYKDVLMRGPFPGHIDPWAEAGHYFHQIHGSMIDGIADQIRIPLLDMGYRVGRETSLQIVANRQPDLYVTQQDKLETARRLDYNAAAAAIMIDPGTSVLADEPDLDALHVKDENGELVTAVEIISPSNKTNADAMAKYRMERNQVFLNQTVNVVEIDPTRSIRHLFQHHLTGTFPYHIAIFIPGDLPRIHVNEFEEPLKQFALPLRTEVVAVEPQDAYRLAYQRYTIALDIHQHGHYTEDDLPFPSTLTGQQRKEALEAVQRWQDDLKRLEAS